MNYLHFMFLLALDGFVLCSDDGDDHSSDLSNGGNQTGGFFKVEGKVVIPKELNHFLPDHWAASARILLNYGEHVGFIRDDYTFVVSGVPSGSYIVEVANKEFIFEHYRIDITSKGKIRCRKLNLLQPSAVSTVQYPIKFLAKQPARYFRVREVWRVTDFLMNPMVLMMVVPFLLIMVLPKLVNTSDPEFQREMQQSLQMPKYDWPDMSEYLAGFYSGKKPGKKQLTKSKKT